MPSLSSSLNPSPKSDDSLERYSRKVFVGGLPPDIDEGSFIWELHEVKAKLPRDHYPNGWEIVSFDTCFPLNTE